MTWLCACPDILCFASWTVTPEPFVALRLMPPATHWTPFLSTMPRWRSSSTPVSSWKALTAPSITMNQTCRCSSAQVSPLRRSRMMWACQLVGIVTHMPDRSALVRAVPLARELCPSIPMRHVQELARPSARRMLAQVGAPKCRLSTVRHMLRLRAICNGRSKDEEDVARSAACTRFVLFSLSMCQPFLGSYAVQMPALSLGPSLDLATGTVVLVHCSYRKARDVFSVFSTLISA